jgi:tetratricopeptide (TPR) repeat protein
MAKKRRLQRRRIKEDQLVTTTLRVSNYVQEHFTQVISGIVILLAAVAIIVFTAQARKNTARVAERELALAMGQYQAGELDLAGTTFASLADRYSGHYSGVVALYFLGQCNLERFRFDEALSAFDRFLDKSKVDDPFRIAAQIGKAYAYEGLQDFREAATTLEGVSGSMDPDDGRLVDVLYSTASFHRRAGDPETAAVYYRRVLDEGEGPLKERAAVWLALIEA